MISLCIIGEVFVCKNVSDKYVVVRKLASDEMKINRPYLRWYQAALCLCLQLL